MQPPELPNAGTLFQNIGICREMGQDASFLETWVGNGDKPPQKEGVGAKRTPSAEGKVVCAIRAG